MKRIVVISLLVLGVIVAAKHHSRREHARAARELPSAWPNAPLQPRTDAVRSTYRFAAAPAVRIEIAGVPHLTTVAAVDGSPFADEQVDSTPDEPSVTDVRVVKSDLKYNEDRALGDLQAKIQQTITTWLEEAGVPSDWKPPRDLVTGSLRDTPRVAEEPRDFGTMYLAAAPIDLSRARKELFLNEYHRHVAGQRLGIVGGGFAFVLAVLAVGVGYVRTDEATKGYYTNRLRLLAAAGVGAAGVVLYQWVARHM